MSQPIWRNSLFNFLGQGWQAILALLTLSVLIRGLGADRYGLLSLIAALLNVVFLMDLGIGAALVKYIAELRARGEQEGVARLIGSCLSIYTGLGILFFVFILWFGEAVLVHVFKVPEGFLPEASAALRVGGLSIPVVFPLVVLLSIPTALQRMDISNALSASVATVNSLGSVGLVSLGYGVVAIISWQVFSNLLYLGLAAWIWNRYFGDIGCTFCLDRSILRRVLQFSGFKVFSSLSGIAVFHLDRLLVGLFFSFKELAYYSVAVAIAQKLLTLMGQVTLAVFPAVGSTHGRRETNRARGIYMRYSRFGALLTLPIAIGLFIHAREILRLWTGEPPDIFAENVLRAFSVGFWLAAFAGVPGVFAEGMGRPDIPAFFSALSAVLNVSFTLLLIPHWGPAAPGIALVVNAVLQVPWFIHTVNRQVAGVSSRRYLHEVFLKPIQAGAILCLLFWVSKVLLPTGAGLITGTIGGLVAFGAVIYANGTLTDDEKCWIQTRLRSFAPLRN